MVRGGIIAALLVVILAAPAAPQQPIPAVLAYEVVAEYPHDDEAFTQGLDFRGKALFETTGLRGKSTLRRVDLDTGDVLRSRSLRKKFFGEGMTIFKRKLFWITWQENRGFVFRPRNFRRIIDRFSYKGEGWGLTHNRRRLIMSNGSDVIRFRDPQTFRVKRSITVTSLGEPVEGLNELEWYKGSILANVFPTDMVARIDPRTGDVTGWLDLSALRSDEKPDDPDAVTNGIAYMRSEDRLFVTGKLWAHVYEIELIE